ncbi:MAG TPA: hypothetical protein VNB94_10530 [Mycobacteriales bacterium]|nr:hypothetical protein [Mycobacteriales bacterium]
MKRVLCTAVAVAGFVGFAGAPAASATTYAAPKPLTVTYSVGDDNVRVGTSLPGQPLVGAKADVSEAEVCVGFSYQIPFCLSDHVDPGELISLG